MKIKKIYMQKISSADLEKNQEELNFACVICTEKPVKKIRE